MKLNINVSFVALPVLFSFFLFGIYFLLKSLFDFPELTLLPLTFIFLFFGSLSLALFAIIEVVFIKNKEVVGMSFMLITTIKTIIIGIIAKTYILTENISFEKWNYFILFILYLLFETVVIGRRLNKTVY